ncbi:hypothetical protein DRQ25_06930 [Candidatus Fermentibacteria bacterium]|nr:MAG: hypothetical protein DRQ25_06930 [Candidatus Fermentibacteria bacterium]
MKSVFVPFLFLLILALGCHEVMEYQSNDQSRLTFIRSSDFQVERSMGGLQQGRALLSGGSNEIILLSADGTLSRIDSEDMIVDTSYTIGGSSGTGYGDAAIATNGNLYVLGPGSQVIEVNLATNIVEDHFSPGSKPGSICASSTMGRLYFTDSSEDYIGEIWTSNNHTNFTSNTLFPLADIMIEPIGGRHVIAVCSNDAGSIYGIWLNLSETARFLQVSTGSPCSKVIPIGSDSVYVVCCPNWSSANGYLTFVRGYVDIESSARFDVTGHPMDMCFNLSSGYLGYLYVMSKTDSGNTVITVLGFPYSHTEPEVIAVINIDGFPRDVIAPSDGEYLIVLTSD